MSRLVIGELGLNGYVIELVYEHGRQIGVRLLETAAADPPASRRPACRLARGLGIRWSGTVVIHISVRDVSRASAAVLRRVQLL